MTTERDKTFYVERRGKKPLPDEAQGYPNTVGLTIVHRVVIFIHHDSASSKESENRGSHRGSHHLSLCPPGDSALSGDSF